MADVRREMERLRPVYETGVLRLLLRGNSMLYVALLRSTFDPLTGELVKAEGLDIDDVFGGWTKAQKDHFANGGTFDQISKR